MNAIKSKRYAGLIKQAVELHVTVEEKGWKLAEVVYEAVQELRAEGFILVDHVDPARMSAVRRVAADVNASPSMVERYHKTWTKFGAASKRDQSLTFHDHLLIAVKPSSARAVRKRRAEVDAKPLHPVRRSAAPAVNPLNPFQRFNAAKSSLRKINDSNIWDYPDREKALAYAQEIHQLAVEVLTKFGGQQQAPRRRAKAA